MASPKYEVAFIYNETTGAAATGLTLTFDTYKNDLGTNVTQPTITEIGGGAYRFLPVFSDAERGIVYILNAGAGYAPRRSSRYMRPEDWTTDTIPTLALEATSQSILTQVGASSGTGAEVLTVTVRGLLASPVAGASVVTKNAANAIVAVGTTNASGVCLLNTGPGALTIYATYTGLVFPATAKTVVAGINTTQTIDGTATSTPAAIDPTLCAVYATLRNLGGTVVAGVVGTAIVDLLPAAVSGSFISGTQLSATSNASGVISWTVPRGAKVVFQVPNHFASRGITVPNAASADLLNMP